MVEKKYFNFNAVVHKEILISVFHNAEYYSITVYTETMETSGNKKICSVQFTVFSMLIEKQGKMKKNGGIPTDTVENYK